MSLGGVACGEWDAEAGKVFGSSTNPSTSARSGSSGSSGQFSSAAGRLHCRPGHPATRRERQAHTLCPNGHGSSFRRANGICVIRLQVAASSSHVDSVSRTGCCVPNRPPLRQSKIPGENNITFARKPSCWSTGRSTGINSLKFLCLQLTFPAVQTPPFKPPLPQPA